MLSGIRIVGFKRFVDANFSLAPMTILTGLNGSGKTSLVQTILLAQEASTNSTKSLPLNGPFGINLGTAEDVLNWNSTGPIEIEIAHTEDSVAKWVFEVPNEEAMYLGITSAPQKTPKAFSGTPRSFSFLSAERFGPRIIADTSPLPQSSMEVGQHGEFCAHVLSVLGDDIIHDPMRSHPNRTESRASLLKYEVEEWLSEIARPIEITGERISNSTIAELRYRTPGSTWVRATNMGFGITYALPVVLAGLTTIEGGLLIVENPEAHLHPAGQSRMGVFLAWLAGRGVQCIIETHSDHVLNGIRRSIAEFGYLQNIKAIVHYFEGDSEISETRPNSFELRFAENGSITDWPKGFFDQYQIDVAALGKVRRKRL